MSICTHCGLEFSCGMADAGAEPGQPCWCAAMPKVPAEALAASDAASCRCPACLKAWIAALEQQQRKNN
jgi:hypothetical protein